MFSYRRIPNHPSCQQRRGLVWGVIQLKCALPRRWWSTGTLRCCDLLMNDCLWILIPGYGHFSVGTWIFYYYEFLSNHDDTCHIAPPGKLSSLSAKCLESVPGKWTDKSLQVRQHHNCQGTSQAPVIMHLFWEFWKIEHFILYVYIAKHPGYLSSKYGNFKCLCFFFTIFLCYWL